MLLDDVRLNAAVNAVVNDPQFRAKIIKASSEEIRELLQQPNLVGVGQVLTSDELAYCVGQAALLKAQLGSDAAAWTQQLQIFLNGGPGG
jgi:hypothetical protein